VRYQLLDALVEERLPEVGGEPLHGEAAPGLLLLLLQLLQAAAEVVVGVAGNVHVAQGEVHPSERSEVIRRGAHGVHISSSLYDV